MPSDVIIYDPMGVAVEIPRPPEEPRPVKISAEFQPNLQDRYREYVSWNLSPSKISDVCREADTGEPQRLMLLCEEMLEKDPKLKSVAGTRKRAVKGLYWDVSPCELGDDAAAADREAAEEIARHCSSILRTSNFLDLLGNLLTAITKPFAVSWIDWMRDYEGAAVPRFSTVPATHVHWSFKSNEIRVFNPSAPSGNQGDMGVAVEPFTTVRALYNPDEDHPTRSGLGRSVAFYELFKSIAIKDWMAFNERFGMPLRVLKVREQDWLNEEFRRLWRDALHNMGTDGSAVINDSAALEMVAAAAATGESPFLLWIEYCDRQIAQLYLGHELSSQSSPGSGQNGITAAMEVLQSVVQDDCQWISSIIKRDVLRPIVGFNHGWGMERFTPELYFDFEPEVDLFVSAKVDNILATTFPDLARSRTQLMDKYGLEAPHEDDPEDEIMPATQPVSSEAPSDEEDPDADPEEVTPEDGGRPSRVESPKPSVQSRQFAAKRRQRRGPSRYSPSKQRKLDKLAARSRKKVALVLENEWGKKLRALLRKLAADGAQPSEIRQAIVKMYPELGTKELERELTSSIQLARLFGRNG